MKEWEKKEVIVGLVIILFLGIIALFLLIRRETGYPGVPRESAEGAVLEQETEADTLPLEKADEKDTEEEKKKELTKQEPDREENPIKILPVPDSEEEIPSAEADLYSVLGEESYSRAVLTERKEDDGQLKELADYWEDYQLNAVDELIRLERFQSISAELADTDHFYYYGSLDPLGRPQGKGLAVYKNNTYYYGEWKEGMRHGKGMWLQAVMDTGENRGSHPGVTEHSYNGQWSRDLPNGEGQEHYTYDYDVLRKMDLQDDKAIANVLGSFKNGYYHGEMYIMTTDNEGNTSDWSGSCREGVWEILMEGNTTDAVWETYTDDPLEETEYHFMFPEHNKDWGIYGLKK